MPDADTTIAALRTLIDEFVAARDWRQFHDAKNLSASIAIEAAELMEHFQWVRSEDVHEVKADAEQMTAIREEIADILAYVLAFANSMDIDLSEALKDKLTKNEAKYPVVQFYGSTRAIRVDADLSGARCALCAN